MYTLSFFGLRRLLYEKETHWSLLLVLRFSKHENTIKNSLSWARQKSMRQYHIEHTSIPSWCSLNYEEISNDAFRWTHILHIVFHYGSFPPLGRLCSEYYVMSLPWIPWISLVQLLPQVSPIVVISPVS